jgi:hypothetical protein
LDSVNSALQSTLSGDERSFFIELVKSRVPLEHRDIGMVLEAARAGHTTPTDLTSVIVPCLPEDWTDLAKRTHISGVLARAVDLGLIRRIWDGKTVTYRLSPTVDREWDVMTTTAE